MRKIILVGLLVVLWASFQAFALEGPPYTYQFPKAPTDWGNAVSFGNLSPGFFQVMFQNSKSGIVRIATYGIVGASMDNLRDPQLMMVFAFDQKSESVGKFYNRSLAINAKP